MLAGDVGTQVIHSFIKLSWNEFCYVFLPTKTVRVMLQEDRRIVKTLTRASPCTRFHAVQAGAVLRQWRSTCPCTEAEGGKNPIRVRDGCCKQEDTWSHFIVVLEVPGKLWPVSDTAVSVSEPRLLPAGLPAVLVRKIPQTVAGQPWVVRVQEGHEQCQSRLAAGTRG